MQPLAIVEAFDERKDVLTRLVARLIGSVMNEFVLERAEEAFRHGIVIAIALAAHARRDAERRDLVSVSHAPILCALIGVMNEPRLHPPLSNGHRECIERQVLIRRGPHRPPDHPPGIRIQEHGDIQPPGSGRDGRHITDPDGVEAGRDKALLEEIRGWRRELMVFDDHAESTHAPRFQADELSQPSHAMPPTLDSVLLQGLPQLDRPIRFPRLPMQAVQHREQSVVRFVPGTQGPPSPRKVAAATDIEGCAETWHTMRPGLIPNERVSHRDSLAKYRAAFFKISRSSVTCANSRFSCASSAAGCA